MHSRCTRVACAVHSRCMNRHVFAASPIRTWSAPSKPWHVTTVRVVPLEFNATLIRLVFTASLIRLVCTASLIRLVVAGNHRDRRLVPSEPDRRAGLGVVDVCRSRRIHQAHMTHTQTPCTRAARRIRCTPPRIPCVNRVERPSERRPRTGPFPRPTRCGSLALDANLVRWVGLI